MDPRLLITNAGFTISIVISLGLGIFVYLRGPKQEKNIVFFILMLFATIFEVSHLLGINIENVNLSRTFFMLNAATMFIVPLNLHLLFCVADKIREKRKSLFAIYAAGIALFAFFMFFPDHFMLPSKPIFYFPNYYNRGDLYFLSDIYFFSILISLFYHYIRIYRRAGYILRNRLKYFLFAIIAGYTTGLTPLLPLYGIPFDPFLSSLFWFYGVFLGYAIFKYDLIDLHLIAKKAFLYGVSVAGVSLFIIVINTINEYITNHVPGFSPFIIPIASGFIAIGVAHFVWKRTEEADVLKYEFVNVVTHKFRTPLTYIGWSVNSLLGVQSEKERMAAIAGIKNANLRLVELTNILTETADSERSNYLYKFELANLASVAQGIIHEYQRQIEEKRLILHLLIDDNVPEILMDKKRMGFVIQVLFENALSYTPTGNSITIHITKKAKDILFSIQDTGIGIGKEDLSLVFSKFFRSKKATATDTEGMGVGLFIAKHIIERHDGKIWAESEGEGKGATFSIELRAK
ncbi:MAG: hypothetical protein A2836_00985 [Candidatus Taylorbacteria bacterium RIFCSPHIGHO2_01_FULL_45_63]|uniref:histidine kinase n=1 Tax=Candidatus Taylorbacteria bacterium RIFCSPHIGHO2_02_FULL_45_35 TaxID=1802311 RepID=A0A1G2MS95_9BACT|nr:MAG: hypothetical protein A2836_00985 [Candidatus Taylorbacteria bacterium RIFCSPHIGHO2_01_FULL_45_63]OHA25872.1 MAG: hypothetical protein A3D56_01755 [Candidatus Taylorbacteria bacterium RIFCSPHIGHO2_02_FULL_45_35]OHA32362.1 MAG: hypothetical protein A3A22_03585 [Candidatus Taylorbacteria bacterium RIFCSPLOWO2_01_FULL_45_34b]